MNVGDNCRTAIWQLPNKSVVYDILGSINDAYTPVHTYLSIAICAIGAICNFCNIVVLTRKTMRTPVNMILTAMACCDTVVLFSNLIYTTHFSFVAFINCHPRNYSYGWAMFLIAHAHLSLVGHTSSVWLSVMLALIRYLTLRSRGNLNGTQIGPKHSYIAIASVIIFVLVMNGPNFLAYRILEAPLRSYCDVSNDPAFINAKAFLPGISELAVKHDCFIFRMVFWVSGTVFKMLPCILLTIFVLLLMKILREVKQNRVRLLKGSTCGPHNNGISPSPIDKRNVNALCRNNSLKQNGRSHSVHTSGRTDRTTKMLLAIVGVFLITELPQGIMAILSGVFSNEFSNHVYRNLGNFLDLMALCNACTTYIIYCTMSAQFRNEFRRVFMPAGLQCSKDQGEAGAEGYFLSAVGNKTQPKASVCSGPPDDHESTHLTVVNDGSARRRVTLDSPPLRHTNHLFVPDCHSGASTSTLNDIVNGDERARLLNGNRPPSNASTAADFTT